MKMETTPLANDMEHVEDESAEQLLASCSFLDKIFGDPEMIPRVGDQFQAEIPSLVGDCRSLQVLKEPIDSKVVLNMPKPSSLELPIPIIWTKTEIENTNEAFETKINEEKHIMPSHGCAEYKVKSQCSAFSDEIDMTGYSMLQPTAEINMDVDLMSPNMPKSELPQVDRGLYPLPGSLSEVWKDIEFESFLLGLYIFGKNFILVKSFVESKEMGEILSFYYGKFFRSDGYQRWSSCRKLRGRRCNHGEKLFTGWRQQELLSRLFSHLSKECQDILLQVSKAFSDEKVTFEEYVFTIKKTVGISLLIKAMGIGKGKQDLTGNAMEPVKANHVVPFRPEIPVGKACSGLTSADIIKFLTGDFRLSKAKSNDLFWEAVWPRLLARGWHSEQPKDQAISGSKNSLVFLIPGIKKFSRRRLVKGNHYFDSVSDVLNKVASEPGLLELEIEVPKGDREEEKNKWDTVIKQDPDVVTKKRNSYLKPRNAGCNRDLMKFTIVDTSLVQRAEQSKVRELRSLPPEASCLSARSSISSDSEEDTSDDSSSEAEAEETSTSSAAEATANGRAHVDFSGRVNYNSDFVIPHTSDTSIISVENCESQDTSPLDEDDKKAMTYEYCQKMLSSDSKYLAPATKQYGLMGCLNGESSCSVENISSDRKLSEDNLHCRSYSPDACDNMVCQTGSRNLSPANSLSKGSPNEGKEGIVNENYLCREESPTKSWSHALIDLNVPQASVDFETTRLFSTETVQNSDNSGAHMLSLQSEIIVQPEPLKLPDKSAEVNQPPIMHNRRQSTRNRPLTTKALEALEYGFFSTKRKRKAAEAPQNKQRRVHGRPVVSAIFRNGASHLNTEEG